MKLIKQRNLSELEEKYIHIDTINGYNVYIPTAYNNSLSYLKKNCPIWIQIDDKENCHIFILDKDSIKENAEEINSYINNLPTQK